jgi:hypothetical protein
MVDGPVSEAFRFGRLIRERKAGDTVSIDLLRGGCAQSVSATLEERTEVSPMFERKVLALHCRDASGAEKDCPAPAGLAASTAAIPNLREVRVICQDEGDCTCTVNGEDKACPENVLPLPLVSLRFRLLPAHLTPARASFPA